MHIDHSEYTILLADDSVSNLEKDEKACWLERILNYYLLWKRTRYFYLRS